MTAAERKTFMECSHAFSLQHTTARTATPSTPTVALQTVRPAGSWRLRPVVPDRTAFGAAIERETQRDYAENQCQSPEHRRATPHAPHHTTASQAFSSRVASVHFHKMHLRMPIRIRARSQHSCSTN